MDLAICRLCTFTTAVIMLTMVHQTQGVTLASMVMVGMADDNAVADLMTEEGDTVSVVCHIIGFEDSQIVSITRVTDTGAAESLLWNNSATEADSTKHIEFDGYLEIAPGSFLYTLIIHNVTKLDAGTYSCIVFNSEGNRFTPVVSDESDLRVLHLPDPMYPTCDIISQDKSLTRYEGDRVTFYCESEIGDPEVFLDWELSSRGPYLPRPNEGIEDGFFKTEIVVELELGHNGKTFDCILTSGLDYTYHPKCSIGPYNVERRPTTPKPPTTQSPDLATGSDNVVIRTSKPTTPSTDATTGNTVANSKQMGGSPGLGKAAIAGICVIIVLTFCIMLIFAAAYLIKTNKYWAPSESKSPLSEKSPDGNANLDVSDTGPTLLGFKKRLSKKASLKPRRDLESGTGYEYENGMLAAAPDFDTIAEGRESPSTPLSSQRPTPSVLNPIPPSDLESEFDDNTSPLSQHSDQPFLKSTEKLDGFGFTSSPPDVSQSTEEEPPEATSEEIPSPPPPEQETPQESQTPRTSSSLSVSGEELEGEWEPAGEQEAPPEAAAEVDVDPSAPRNLPQDVMDILMDLDLDLFANEATEDTEL